MEYLIDSQHNHLSIPVEYTAAPAVSEPASTTVDSVPTNIDLNEATREFQRSLIERTLAENDGN